MGFCETTYENINAKLECFECYSLYKYIIFISYKIWDNNTFKINENCKENLLKSGNGNQRLI